MNNQLPRHCRCQSLCLGSLDHGLHQIKKVGRPRAGNCRDCIQMLFILNPEGCTHSTQNLLSQLAAIVIDIG